MQKAYYDIYEGDTLILQCVTKAEINRALGCNIHSMANYTSNGYLINKRYRIRRVDNKPMDAEFTAKWQQAVEPFKSVIWSKTEGKKLKGR